MKPARPRERAVAGAVLFLLLVVGCTREGGTEPQARPTTTAAQSPWAANAEPHPQCDELVAQLRDTSPAIANSFGLLDASPKEALAELERARLAFQEGSDGFEAEAGEAAADFDKALGTLIDATGEAVSGTDVDSAA